MSLAAITARPLRAVERRHEEAPTCVNRPGLEENDVTVPTGEHRTTQPLVQGTVARRVATIEGLGMQDAMADRDALMALNDADTLNTKQRAFLDAAIRELSRARKALRLARSVPSNRAQFERDAEAQIDLALGLLDRAREAGENEASPLQYASGRVVTSREMALAVIAGCVHLLTGAPA